MTATPFETSSKSTATLAVILRSIERNVFPDVWIWVAMLLIWVADIAWIVASPRIAMDANYFLVPAYFTALAAILAIPKNSQANYTLITLERLRQFMFLQLFITPAVLGIGILNQLAMTIPFPMSDDLLMSWDQALGFDWLNYARAVTSHPYLTLALETAYSLLISAIFLVSTILIVFGKRQRASEFCALVMLTAALCIMLASIFPAFEVPYVLSHSTSQTKLPANFGTHHVEQLLAMRSDNVLLDPKTFKGLSSLPSYHTIAGLLIVYACRGYVFLLAPAIAYTSLMLVSTPVFGGHYLVDIIAGFIFTIVFLMFWRKYSANQSNNNIWL